MFFWLLCLAVSSRFRSQRSPRMPSYEKRSVRSALLVGALALSLLAYLFGVQAAVPVGFGSRSLTNIVGIGLASVYFMHARHVMQAVRAVSPNQALQGTSPNLQKQQRKFGAAPELGC